MSSISAGVIAGFLAVKGETPNGGALASLIVAFCIGALYLTVTSSFLVKRFPVLARLPGAKKEEPVITHDKSINITTHNQSGGTNIGKLVIGSPQPSVVQGRTITENEKTDEGYVNRGEYFLQQPYAAKNLCIKLNRSDVKDFQVGPKGGGAWTTRDGWDKHGNPVILLEEPLVSVYEVWVTSDQPIHDLKVEAILDVNA